MTIATHVAGERRHRRPDQPIAGHPDIPAFDRHSIGQTAPRGAARMARVLCMAATGVWAIRLDGRFVEVGGCNCWNDRETLNAAAQQAGVTLSDLVVVTGR